MTQKEEREMIFSVTKVTRKKTSQQQWRFKMTNNENKNEISDRAQTKKFNFETDTWADKNKHKQTNKTKHRHVSHHTYLTPISTTFERLSYQWHLTTEPGQLPLGERIRNSDARLALWSVNKTILLPVEGDLL